MVDDSKYQNVEFSTSKPHSASYRAAVDVKPKLSTGMYRNATSIAQMHMLLHLCMLITNAYCSASLFFQLVTDQKR